VNCGVPAQLWVEVQLYLWFGYSLCKLATIIVNKYCYDRRFLYNLITTSIYSLATLGWTIYGLILLLNPKNKCMEDKQT